MIWFNSGGRQGIIDPTLQMRKIEAQGSKFTHYGRITSRWQKKGGSNSGLCDWKADPQSRADQAMTVGGEGIRRMGDQEAWATAQDI